LETPGSLQNLPQSINKFSVIFQCRFETCDGPCLTYNLIHKHNVFVVKVCSVDHFIYVAFVYICSVEVEHYLHGKEFADAYDHSE
jgi:hypothetical protein